MTARKNLYVDQGVDFLIPIEIETSIGMDYDVSNKQFYCDVRKVYSSTVAFSASLQAIQNNISNDVELIISADTTVDVEPNKYQYDIIMVDQTGENKKILEGLLFVLPTITRDYI